MFNSLFIHASQLPHNNSWYRIAARREAIEMGSNTVAYASIDSKGIPRSQKVQWGVLGSDGTAANEQQP